MVSNRNTSERLIRWVSSALRALPAAIPVLVVAIVAVVLGVA